MLAGGWCGLCCLEGLVLNIGDALLAGGSQCVLTCSRAVCVSRLLMCVVLPGWLDAQDGRRAAGGWVRVCIDVQQGRVC